MQIFQPHTKNYLIFFLVFRFEPLNVRRGGESLGLFTYLMVNPPRNVLLYSLIWSIILILQNLQISHPVRGPENVENAKKFEFSKFLQKVDIQLKRPSLRETAKNEKAKMADQYETYIDGNYSRRDNYWQNIKFFGGLQKSIEHFKDFEPENG